MKKYILIIAIILTIFGCKNETSVFENGGVSQTLLDMDDRMNQELCQTTNGCVVTMVWVNKKLIWTKFRQVTSGDSAIKADSIKGYEIYNTALKYK